MVKGRTSMNLDGDFRRQYPEPVTFSARAPGGGWTITKAGPRYLNVYEVTSFDEAGEAWLIENDVGRGKEGAWRCTATRSHGRCNTLNGAEDETCGACGADRPKEA